MCMFCKCDTVRESITTHVVNYKNCVIVVKNVPCEECEQCGEKFYSDEREEIECILKVCMAIYDVSPDDMRLLIQTDADGFWGYVTEFSKGNKLEGVEVFLSLGENYDFESAKELLESLIECKLSEID